MNSLLWKRKLGRWFGRALAERRDVILLYHSVDGGGYSIPGEQFRLQMAWLKKHARVITLHDMLAPRAASGLDLGGRFDLGFGELFTLLQSVVSRSKASSTSGLRVALTFDDGYHTLARTVQPILVEHDFPATVYLNTGMIGAEKRLPSRPELGHYPDEEFMNWSDVFSLNKHAWTVGGHGIDHVDLTAATADEARAQLAGCKEKIQSMLGRPCAHFAYTWGRNDARVRAATAAAGYFSGVGGVHAAVSASSNQFALPRIDVRSDYELVDFVDAAVGRWDFLGIKQRFA